MIAVFDKKEPAQYCNLSYKNAIDKWDEALPLGNGLCGCLIWGDGSPLRISLDRGDLWDTRAATETTSHDFTYKKLIELVKNKDQNSIREKFDRPYYRATPTKIPAGNIFLNYAYKADKVGSILDLQNASSKITIISEDKCSLVHAYLHATRKIGFIHISGNADLPEIEIKSPDFGVTADIREENKDFERNLTNGSLKQLKYPPAVFGEEGGLLWFVQKTAGELEYGIVLGKKMYAGELEIAFIIASSVDHKNNWLDNAKSTVKEVLEEGFSNAFVSHIKWWEDFWSKSSMDIPDKFFEKQWYMTNYLFGSCSRKAAPPMPLQGVWTADNGELPPWKGDYHHDLNTQISYWHYMKANHIEEGESFVDFLWELVPEARKFAKRFFDAPGLCLPSVMAIDGNALGGWPMYTLTLTNQAWLCQAFVNHWYYTGDRDFLENKAYPYLKETAQCILRWLMPDNAGKLKLPLSSSSEIHDDELEAWLTPNSNYDLSLVIYIFQKLIDMSEILKNGDTQDWINIRKALPELAVNEKNVLMLSPDESLQESHRHFGHAMAIYPLKLLNYKNGGKDKEIIDATVENLELLGSGLWVGFSFPWMAEFYAIQGNGEGAAFQLKLFWENFCSSNGFHLNGDYKRRGVSSLHYRPFTLEANMAAADALQEMLLNTDGGVIEVFPAIPEEWAKKGVSFRNLRGWNGILISARIKDLIVSCILLKASQDGDYSIVNRFGTEKLIIEKNGGKSGLDCQMNAKINIYMEKNEECLIYKPENEF